MVDNSTLTPFGLKTAATEGAEQTQSTLFGTRENLPGFDRQKFSTPPMSNRQVSAVLFSDSGRIGSQRAVCRAANGEAKANLNPWRPLSADLGHENVSTRLRRG